MSNLESKTMTLLGSLPDHVDQCLEKQMTPVDWNPVYDRRHHLQALLGVVIERACLCLKALSYNIMEQSKVGLQKVPATMGWDWRVCDREEYLDPGKILCR